MSRGRRSGPPTSFPAAPAPRACPDLPRLLGRELAGFISGVLDGSIALEDPPAGGGLAGDPDHHAGDLVELALLARGGGRSGNELAAELLRRAHEHQSEHIARFEAAREHPRSSGARIWSIYGLPHGSAAVSAGYLALRRERQRLRSIERLQRQTDVRGSMRKALGRVAMRHITRPVLGSLLADDPAGALELAESAAAMMADQRLLKALDALTPAAEAAASRLARADLITGSGPHPLDLLAEQPERALRSWLLERAAGDEGEAAIARHWQAPPDPDAPVLFAMDSDHFGHTGHPVLEPAGDAGTALARARGLLRRPELHAPRQSPGTGRLVTVPVSRAAFAELSAAADQELELLRGPGAEGEVRAALVRRGLVRSQGGDHPIEVRFCLPLGSSSRRSLATLTTELVEPAGLALAHPLTPSRTHPWPDRDTAGAPGATRAVALRHRCEGPRRTLEELLGPDECGHPGARWRLNARRDAAVLGCPRCLRRRVALEPLHRIPPSHPLWAESGHDVASYLRAERAARVIAGEADFGPQVTLGDLIDRHGLADLDPGAHAIAATGPAGSARRPRSLAETLARR